MKSLDTSFGSCEPKEPYPLPCFNLITLISYLFSLLPFACIACLCASLCLCTLALTPYPTRCVGLSTYVIKSFLLSHQSFSFLSSQSFFFTKVCFTPPPLGLVTHFSLSPSTLFTFLTSFSQLASLPACCCCA